jgi:hypothetical protein
MAEQQTPTFKLVLVGDGGTGKVRSKTIAPMCAFLVIVRLQQWRWMWLSTTPPGDENAAVSILITMTLY